MTAVPGVDVAALTRLVPLDGDSEAMLARAVAASPDPPQTLHTLVGIAEANPDETRAVLATDVGRTTLVTVAGASRSLALWLRTHPDELVDLASSFSITAQPDRDELCRRAHDAIAGDAPLDALRRFRRRWFLRIALRDLLFIATLQEVGRSLSDLADACLSAGLALAADTDDVAACGLAVIGMGKLGGRELNYSSDVDVLLVAADDRDHVPVARRLLEFLGQPSPEGIVWRVDADLRPEGRSGQLVRSLDSYLAYYERWADTWEFQALIKRRAVAGDAELGERFCEAAEPFVYPRTLPPDALEGLRAMKARAEHLVTKSGMRDREVKLGPGGIRDVEFAVQLLQLVHGRHDTGIRSPNTLTALGELSTNGYIDVRDAETLSNSYIKLRTVEHRLQLENEAQVHALPAQDAQLERLARVLGHRPDASGTAAEHFLAEFRADVATVRTVHERLFYRPLLEAFAGSAPDETAGGAPGVTVLPEQAAEERLAVFGFSNVQGTRRALGALTSGLSRRSKLMEATLPLILGWLSDTPDPDLGLLMLDNLTSQRHSAETLTAMFRESPLAAQRLCTVAGTSRWVAEAIQRFPELLLLLNDDRALADAKDLDDLAGEVERQLAWREDDEERRKGIRRFVRRERARIAMRDILGFASTQEVGAELTALAEACLRGALATVTDDRDDLPPIAVIGMGRLSGGELAYPSDLDVMVVCGDPRSGGAGGAGGGGGAGTTAVEKVVAEFIQTVAAPTGDGSAWDLDLDLRPEGRSGALVRTLSGYVGYWERWAETWEFQSLLRARPVAGDAELGAAFMAAAEPFVYADPYPAQRTLDVRRMKARIDKDRLPRGADASLHLKLGRGGLVDVEFAVQLLQLQHGAADPSLRTPSTLEALARCRAAGLLDAASADRMHDAYDLANRIRNRLALLRVRDTDALPADTQVLSKLARSLGHVDDPASTLREEWRRSARMAHQAADAVLYPPLDAPEP